MSKGKKIHDLSKNIQEKAVLVGIITQGQDPDMVKEHLDELAFLTETAGAVPIKQVVQKMDRPHSKTFLGKGKIAELAVYVKDEEIDMVIFDDELSPSQLRNIEELLEVKILDRNNLILDIFASRAQTAHAKAQVELAQYQYLLPRLTNLWTHLSRQKGGVGMKGPGETEIETDRRIVRDKISKLQHKLKKISTQKSTQRSNREQMIRVALIGYTNVGKSTILNTIAKTTILAENKLFATLDTTVRKVVVENLPFLLSDTVGFIRKLPHGLVESFKSTLDEVREADLLIHVVDISHPAFEDHIKVVNETLTEIASSDKPTLLVFNKIDAYTWDEKDFDDLTPATKENLSLADLKSSWMAKQDCECIFISAQKKDNWPEFRAHLYKKVRALHIKRYPYNDFLYPDPESYT
ncbi:MAG: GTP-binding protein HflX [Saprospiraceae bacterium]|jgi:GTP-binding protein HflX